jgi:hypothetical protein
LRAAVSVVDDTALPSADGYGVAGDGNAQWRRQKCDHVRDLGARDDATDRRSFCEAPFELRSVDAF